MPIPKLETWMWAEACEMLDRADRLHRQFFRPAITNGQRVNWEPPIDIYETSTEFKILIALPGVIPERTSTNKQYPSPEVITNVFTTLLIAMLAIKFTLNIWFDITKKYQL